MKAVELTSKTDSKGNLNISYQTEKNDAKVRILILMDEDVDDISNDDWIKGISKNPTFNSLKNSVEDIYTLKDGEEL